MKAKKTSENKVKVRGLFDHINHIREVKNKDYYKSLSEEEKKSFNKYMIIRFLSMDVDIIEDVSFVSKYFQNIPEEQFYQVMIDLVPRGRKFCKYIKNSTEGINETILDCICKKYKIGKRDAIDYYNIYTSNDTNLKDLCELIQGFGYSEKEVEKLFK
jgi:hypothetical protein